jgi:hypothetical protein
VAHLFLIVLLIHAKLLLPLLTMEKMGTFTASMGEILAGLLAPAPALATLGMQEIVAKSQLWMGWMSYSTRSVMVAVLTLATPSWHLVTLQF